MIKPTDIEPGRILLREAEAARLLGVGRGALADERKRGRIPFVRVGKFVCYRRAALEHYAESNESSARR